jgi:hypothetical protein
MLSLNITITHKTNPPSHFCILNDNGEFREIGGTNLEPNCFNQLLATKQFQQLFNKLGLDNSNTTVDNTITDVYYNLVLIDENIYINNSNLDSLTNQEIEQAHNALTAYPEFLAYFVSKPTIEKAAPKATKPIAIVLNPESTLKLNPTLTVSASAVIPEPEVIEPTPAFEEPAVPEPASEPATALEDLADLEDDKSKKRKPPKKKSE